MAVFTSLVKGIIGALGINVDHSLLHAFLAEFARPNKKIDPLGSITFSTTFLTDKVNPPMARSSWEACALKISR